MKRRVILILIAVLPLFLLLRALAQAPNARITGFTAPNTDSAGRKAVIKGDAEPARAGIYTIRKLHIDNYRADGQLDSTIDSIECLFVMSNSFLVSGILEIDLSAQILAKPFPNVPVFPTISKGCFRLACLDPLLILFHHPLPFNTG